MSFEQGPYVQVAAFSEKVLDEKDEVKSLIRIIDRVTHQWRGTGTLPEEMEPFDYEVVFTVMLKPGRARGTHRVRLSLESPAAEVRDVASTDVYLEAEDRGTTIVARMSIHIEQAGLYWMRVHVDQQEITRAPLRVVYEGVGLAQSPSSEPETPE